MVHCIGLFVQRGPWWLETEVESLFTMNMHAASVDVHLGSPKTDYAMTEMRVPLAFAAQRLLAAGPGVGSVLVEGAGGAEAALCIFSVVVQAAMLHCEPGDGSC